MATVIVVCLPVFRIDWTRTVATQRGVTSSIQKLYYIIKNLSKKERKSQTAEQIELRQRERERQLATINNGRVVAQGTGCHHGCRRRSSSSRRRRRGQESRVLLRANTGELFKNPEGFYISNEPENDVSNRKLIKLRYMFVLFALVFSFFRPFLLCVQVRKIERKEFDSIRRRIMNGRVQSGIPKKTWSQKQL